MTAKSFRGCWKTCRFDMSARHTVTHLSFDLSQAHKQSLTRKLQEREADLKAKQEQVAQVEQVRTIFSLGWLMMLVCVHVYTLRRKWRSSSSAWPGRPSTAPM